MAKKWSAPRWMRPYLPMIVNTGGNDVTEMMNGNADPRVNLPLSTLQCAVKSQVALLERLNDARALPAPHMAQTLLVLVRQKRALNEIAQSIDLVLTARPFASDPRLKKLRPGMEALAEAARRGLGA